MNIFQAQFATGDVVAATGVSNATLQSWLKRNLIVGHKDDPVTGGGTPGRHRRFSFFNVMEIAVTKALTDVGLDVSDAAKAATAFAHSDHSEPGPMSRERLPSFPFNTLRNPCFTVLCVARDHSAVLPWVPGEDIIPFVRHAVGNPWGWIMLQMNPIFESVVTALGYDYRDVLKDAYSGAAAE